MKRVIFSAMIVLIVEACPASAAEVVGAAPAKKASEPLVQTKPAAKAAVKTDLWEGDLIQVGAAEAGRILVEVRFASGNTGSVIVDADTTVSKGGAAVELQDIELGSRVRVEFFSQGADRIAKAIEVLRGAPAPAPVAAKTPPTKGQTL